MTYDNAEKLNLAFVADEVAYFALRQSIINEVNGDLANLLSNRVRRNAENLLSNIKSVGLDFTKIAKLMNVCGKWKLDAISGAVYVFGVPIGSGDCVEGRYHVMNLYFVLNIV